MLVPIDIWQREARRLDSEVGTAVMWLAENEGGIWLATESSLLKKMHLWIQPRQESLKNSHINKQYNKYDFDTEETAGTNFN